MINPFKLQPCLRTLCLQPPRGVYRGLATATNAESGKSSSTPYPFPTSSLSYHWDTIPPTPYQLKHATEFFKKLPPTFLWSAPKFKTMAFDDSPEVCFLGRSNVGKSSLLNAILGKKIAHTSSKPGRTRSMNAFAVGGSEDNGKNRLVVLDMPGYGKGGHAEWGTQIMKYLSKRRELKRAFLLVDAQHGVKESDRQLLQMFKEEHVPYQIVLSKVDRVLFQGSRIPSPEALESRFSELRRTMESVMEAVQPNKEDDGGAVGDIISCSSKKWIEGKILGIDTVRFAMLQAAGLQYKPKVKLTAPVEVVPHDQLVGMDA